MDGTRCRPIFADKIDFTLVLSSVESWYLLGVALGIETHELKDIEIHYFFQGAKRCLIQLYEVLERKDMIPSWQTISSILRTMDHISLAKKVENEFINCHSEQLEEPSMDEIQSATAMFAKCKSQASAVPVAHCSVKKIAKEENGLESKRRKIESWQIRNTDVALMDEELGRGSWSIVSVGLFQGQRVAVKKPHLYANCQATITKIHKEIITMSQLRHPHLLLFIGAVLDHPSGNPLIITEIMSASLRQVYEKGQLTDDKASKLSILRDTASGLNYLHCHHEITHQNVNSGNILLEQSMDLQYGKWKAKLGGFGSGEKNLDLEKSTGKVIYSSPEYYTDEKISPKIDVYSFGVVAYELTTEQFPKCSSKHMKNALKSIGQVIADCANKDPTKRPAMKQVIAELDPSC